MYSVDMGNVFLFRSARFMIRTKDHRPPHVHVIRGDCEAKLEIENGEIIWSEGFSRNDLRRITEVVVARKVLLLEAWDEIHKEKKG